MSKKWFEVRCDKHGRVEADDKAQLKRLVVGTHTQNLIVV